MGFLPEVKGADPVAAPVAPAAQAQARAPAPAPKRGGRSSILPGSKPKHSGSLLAIRQQNAPQAASTTGKRPAPRKVVQLSPMKNLKQQQQRDVHDTMGFQELPVKPPLEGAFNIRELLDTSAGKGGILDNKIPQWKAPMNQSYSPRPADPDSSVAPSLARGKSFLARKEDSFKGTPASAPSFMQRKRIAPVDPLNQFSSPFRPETESQATRGALPPLQGPKRPLQANEDIATVTSSSSALAGDKKESKAKKVPSHLPPVK